MAAAAKKAANRPAVAMLTAYPPKDADWVTTSDTDKVLVKPMNTQDLLRQIEAMLVAHEDKKRKESKLAAGAGGAGGGEEATEAGGSRGKAGIQRIAFSVQEQPSEGRSAHPWRARHTILH